MKARVKTSCNYLDKCPVWPPLKRILKDAHTASSFKLNPSNKDSSSSIRFPLMKVYIVYTNPSASTRISPGYPNKLFHCSTASIKNILGRISGKRNTCFCGVFGHDNWLFPEGGPNLNIKCPRFPHLWESHVNMATDHNMNLMYQPPPDCIAN